MNYRSVLFSMLFLVLCGAQVQAQSYSAIYIFGDSFCDTGNIWIATNGSIPAAPYYQGRFSNGPIWVDQIGAVLNLPVDPVLGGGTNYAFGGAQMLQETDIPSVPVQVAAYLYRNGGRADPNALYILEGGTNDILEAGTVSPTQLGYEIAVAMATLEAELYAAGATHFLISNVPDVGLLPVEVANVAFATEAAVTTKVDLQGLLFFAGFLQGSQIATLDLFDISDGIVSDPAHDGFTNITTPCLSDGTLICDDPAHTFFWDAVHATTAGDDLIATFAEAQLQL